MRSSLKKLMVLLVIVAVLVAAVSVVSGSGLNQAEGDGQEAAIYIVLLEGDGLASYRGGIENLAATNPSARGESKVDMNSPATAAYLDYLQGVQDAFVDAVEQKIDRSVYVKYNYQIALNGLALELTAAEADMVAAMDSVTHVEQETMDEMVTDTGPTWIGAPGIWDGSATGLPGTFGEGIIVGVLDSGINVVDDHPSFWEVGGDGYVHTNPLPDYVGVCAGGNNDPDLTCNDKMIGYRGYNGETPGDSDGHGSHTASTAAGNFTDAVINATTTVTLTISGVAPHANIISYDVCVVSCPSAGSIMAINDAIADGADVLNFSISGQDNPYTSGVDLAFLGARDAGLFVAASAGNNGPGPDTTNHNAPWLTTVGASTHSRTWTNSLVNMSGGSPPPDLNGRAISAGYGPATIVYAGDFSNGDPDPEQCLNPFPPGTWTNGEIVVCDRGTIARVQKGANVLAGGAGGFVLANIDANGESLSADPHFLPATHIGDAAGDQLRAWLAANPVGSLTAEITEGTYTQDPAIGDIMAGFSSRGPVTSLPDLIQPDVTNPGVDIFAAYADPDDFNFLGGTSMSSPHTAGAGALMMSLHPSWTPAEIQSALMMTAKFDGVLKEDGATPADPFDIGGGRVDLSQAGRTGLVQHETTANYTNANPALGGEVYTLNTPSMGQNECDPTCSWTRSFRNTQDFTVVYSATLNLPAGVTGSVSPNPLTVASGATEDLTVSLDASGGATGTWLFGELVLTPVPQEEGGNGLPEQHLPIAIQTTGAQEPDIEVDPAALDSEQEPDQMVMDTLTISNVGGADLDWQLVEEGGGPLLPSTISVEPATTRVTIGDGFESFSAAGSGPGTVAEPARGETPEGLVTITHSASQSIIQFNSVSCNAGGLHTDNSYLRRFTLSDFGITTDFDVVEVEIGIEQAAGAGGTQPVEMNLYTWDPGDPFTFANLNPIGSANVNLTDQALTIATIPVAGTAPAGSTLVVEFFTPNGQTAGHSLFVGSNNLGQTSPTYLAAADCGVPEPTDTAAIGFPDMHLVMNVTGDAVIQQPECDMPADIPWFSATPLMGTTAPGGDSTVDVTFDSTGLTPDVYAGTLCVESNDPVDPVLRIPVTMTVTEPMVNAAIVMTKTVGLDSATCATTDNINVIAGETVYYCYTVTNTGDITLPLHDLTDDQLGMLLDDFAFDLAPGATVSTVDAGATISATITMDTTNTAVWTAFDDTGLSASFTDTATVTVSPPTDVSLSTFAGNSGSVMLPALLVIVVAAFVGMGLVAYQRRNA